MPFHLARTGIAVFAMLFAIALVTEHPAAGQAIVASSAWSALPPLREVRSNALEPVAVAGIEAAPAIEVPPAAQVVAPSGVVLASWYGPGFYGNHTACGHVYTPEILGVAHLSLPCGTALTLSYGSRSLTVPVIDRGPYIAGRTLDLSNATKIALGCTDLCTLRMQLGR
jgi:rare lipoprotein A (peptidoglycan hydrolase)